MKHSLILSTLIATACAVVTIDSTLAQAPQRERIQEQTQAQTRERIYGSQLMTPQERNEYRRRMRELKTQQEREQFRKEHHERMQARAKERGVTLPAEPPVQGRGMGPRYGDTPGAGAGPQPMPGGGKGR